MNIQEKLHVLIEEGRFFTDHNEEHIKMAR